MPDSLEDRLFILSMWWRIIYGTLRIIFGLAIIKVVGMPLVDAVATLMRYELIEDPNDILYSWVSHLLAQHPIYVSSFLAFYFIFWGVVDIVLSYNLLKYRLWAFPIAMVLIALFVVYEFIRFTHTHSPILIGVAILDTAILWLISEEYKKAIRRQTGVRAAPDG